MPRKTQEEKLAYKAKRARIIDLYNADGDWRRLAMELNVPKSTAYRWVKKGDEIDDVAGVIIKKLLQSTKMQCVIILKITRESPWLRL